MKLHLIPIVILFSIPLFFVYGQSVSDPDFMIYKGIQYASLGEYKRAISIFEDVLKEDKNNIQALVEVGKLYSSIEKYNEAIDRFDQALDIDPNNSQALYGLQIALLESTKYKMGFLDGVLEITVHDSQGALVAYLQTSQIKSLRHTISEKFVESWPVTKTVHRNNQDYSVHQKEFVEILDYDTILGFHEIPFLEKMDLPLASTWHYQIPIERGDVISYVYSFYRPMN